MCIRHTGHAAVKYRCEGVIPPSWGSNTTYYSIKRGPGAALLARQGGDTPSGVCAHTHTHTRFSTTVETRAVLKLAETSHRKDANSESQIHRDVVAPGESAFSRSAMLFRRRLMLVVGSAEHTAEAARGEIA